MKTFRLMLIILLAAGLNSSRAQDTWTKKADFGGAARSAGIGFSIDNKGYIGLGINSSLGLLFKDFWEYDPSTDVWTQKADFAGDSRCLAVGLSINGKGYVGLGTTRGIAGPVIYYKDFLEYNPETNVWTQKSDFGGEARAYAAGFAVSGKVYMGAGSAFIPDEVFYPDFWQYDPVSDIWTQKADFGQRTAPTTFAIGDKGYMGLGYDDWWQTDFYEYDPATDIWTNKAAFPGLGREAPARFVIGTKGYLGPGYGSFSNINDFWEYDGALNQWNQKNNFGGPDRAYAVGFSIGTKGYIGTGGNSSGELKDFWEFTSCNGGLIVHADADADGYGDASDSLFVADCVVPNGYVLNTTDCNDAEAAINPGAIEILNGMDDNCDGIIDDILCNTPTSLSTTNITSTSAELNWNAVPDALSYKVRYKIKNTETWTIVTCPTNALELTGLSAGTTYVWKVKSNCSNDYIFVSDFSPKKYFTTAPLKMGAALSMENSLEIYPNPTAENFTLDLRLQSNTDQSATIYLLNALGQIVYSSKEIAGYGELKKVITMPSTASAGWYMVRVVMNDQVIEKKLMYQK